MITALDLYTAPYEMTARQVVRADQTCMASGRWGRDFDVQRFLKARFTKHDQSGVMSGSD